MFFQPPKNYLRGTRKWRILRSISECQGYDGFRMYSVSQKQPHVHFTIVSIIFGTDYIEKICNTKVIDLLTSPIQCCCTTLGKLFSSFQLIARWFFCGGMRVALKRAGFGDERRMQTWRWTELLEMLELTTTGTPQAVKRSHATSAFSSCRQLKSFPYWAQCQITEKYSRKRTVYKLYLVCITNDVINYYVDKMVLVSLNLNEYLSLIHISEPTRPY